MLGATLGLVLRLLHELKSVMPPAGPKDTDVEQRERQRVEADGVWPFGEEGRREQRWVDLFDVHSSVYTRGSWPVFRVIDAARKAWPLRYKPMWPRSALPCQHLSSYRVSVKTTRMRSQLVWDYNQY